MAKKRKETDSRKNETFPSLCQPRDSGMKIKHTCILFMTVRLSDIEHKITFNYKVNKIMCLRLGLEL